MLSVLDVVLAGAKTRVEMTLRMIMKKYATYYMQLIKKYGFQLNRFKSHLNSRVLSDSVGVKTKFYKILQLHKCSDYLKPPL